MTAPVHVVLTMGSVASQQLVQPGMTHRIEMLGLVDGQQRILHVDVQVVGQPCPDPSKHARPCSETDHDRHGDCDGPVRQYLARNAIAGAGVGEPVEFCSHHAQIHGRHIRKADR